MPAVTGSGLYGVGVPELNRRDMMLMTGIGMLAAAIPVPEAGAVPSRPDNPPPNTQPGNYIFQDEFDGPAGSAPDRSKWVISNQRTPIRNPVGCDRQPFRPVRR